MCYLAIHLEIMSDKYSYFINHSAQCNLDILSIDFANYLDEHDSSGSNRSKFHFPKYINNKEPLYFNGNSLGLMPKESRIGIDEQLEKWANCGSDGHFHEPLPWVLCDEYPIDNMAEIVGANKEEVALMNQLSVNLHLLLVSFYRPTKDRFKILCEYDMFPSDQYVMESQIEWHGYNSNESLLKVKPRENEYILHTEDIIRFIEEHGHTIALICFSGVHYLTGQYFDIEKITKVGHDMGCVIGWDLAHAVGNLPLQLHDWNVDFAAWCSYKYLNSGPGGIGGIFVHENQLKNKTLPYFRGWWGLNSTERFKMTDKFGPAEGALKYRISNASFTSCVLIQTSLKMFKDIGMENLRKKSILLTNYLEYLIISKLNPNIFRIITPSNEKERGSQLSIKVLASIDDVQTIIKNNNIFCDFRKYSILRLSPCAMYNSFTDVFKVVDAFRGLNNGCEFSI